MPSDLEELFAKARAKVEAMPPAEREAMYVQQRDGYARAEASWPAPVYEWVDGVKVYASYEDYCND